MKSKGQTLVFEQVLLFTFGVVILILSFALFSVYQNYYLSETTQDHITQIKEYVISYIITMCESEEFNSSVVVSIPKRITDSFYRIRLSNAGLNVTLESEWRRGDFSNLYKLNESFNFSGMVTSDRGKIVIYKKGSSIIIQ